MSNHLYIKKKIMKANFKANDSSKLDFSYFQASFGLCTLKLHLQISSWDPPFVKGVWERVCVTRAFIIMSAWHTSSQTCVSPFNKRSCGSCVLKCWTSSVSGFCLSQPVSAAGPVSDLLSAWWRRQQKQLSSWQCSGVRLNLERACVCACVFVCYWICILGLTQAEVQMCVFLGDGSCG